MRNKRVKSHEVRKLKDEFRSMFESLPTMGKSENCVFRAIKKKLRMKGWKKIGRGLSREVFGQDNIGYVIKVGLMEPIVMDYPNIPREMKSLTIPETQIITIDQPNYVDGLGIKVDNPITIVLSVQLKVDTKNSSHALKILNDQIGEIIRDYDIHSDNVGWLNGNPVIIDF